MGWTVLCKATRALVSFSPTIMSEKKQDFAGLPSSVELIRHHPPFSHKRTKVLVIGLCLGALGVGGFFFRTLAFRDPSVHVSNQLCPQAKPVAPVKHSAIWDTLVKRSASDQYKEHAIEWLSGAVRIRYASRLNTVRVLVNLI